MNQEGKNQLDQFKSDELEVQQHSHHVVPDDVKEVLRAERPDQTILAPRPLAESSSFISVWDTTLVSTGSSGMSQIRLPLTVGGIYNFNISWGDGSEEVITDSTAIHSYLIQGQYIIKINGTLEGWKFGLSGDRLKLLEISQWGDLKLGNEGGYFEGAENLLLTATDNLNLNGTTNLSQMFRYCKNLGDAGSIAGWNVSQVTDMHGMFSVAWDFNMPIADWNVSSVVDMSNMFYLATVFDQPIGAWDVSNVRNMGGMFHLTQSFNQPLANWNVSQVINMHLMFASAYTFNQPIGSWNVSSVVDMHDMFALAQVFNQPIGSWDVSSVYNMETMFFEAYAFNQDISGWDVSSLQYLNSMFWEATSFNQPIGLWKYSPYVDELASVFVNATSFDQSIGDWDVSKVTDMYDLFRDTTLSSENYDDILIKWSNQALQAGIFMDGGSAQYSAQGKIARDHIVSTFGWEIVDGGQIGVPSAPRNPQVIESEGGLLVSWQEPLSEGVSEIMYYTIYRSISTRIGFEVIGNSTNLSILDFPGQARAYNYVITAHNSLGESQRSIEVWGFLTQVISSDTGSNTNSLTSTHANSTPTEEPNSEFVGGLANDPHLPLLGIFFLFVVSRRRRR